MSLPLNWTHYCSKWFKTWPELCIAEYWISCSWMLFVFRVLDSKNEEIELLSSIECKGIVGNDQRHYILDLLRTFPPDVNFLPGEFFTCVWHQHVHDYCQVIVEVSYCLAQFWMCVCVCVYAIDSSQACAMEFLQLIIHVLGRPFQDCMPSCVLFQWKGRSWAKRWKIMVTPYNTDTSWAAYVRSSLRLLSSKSKGSFVFFSFLLSVCLFPVYILLFLLSPFLSSCPFGTVFVVSCGVESPHCFGARTTGMGTPTACLPARVCPLIYIVIWRLCIAWVLKLCSWRESCKSSPYLPLCWMIFSLLPESLCYIVMAFADG